MIIPSGSDGQAWTYLEFFLRVNTETSCRKELDLYGKYIDLRHVHELSIIRQDHTKMERTKYKTK